MDGITQQQLLERLDAIIAEGKPWDDYDPATWHDQMPLEWPDDSFAKIAVLVRDAHQFLQMSKAHNVLATLDRICLKYTDLSVSQLSSVSLDDFDHEARTRRKQARVRHPKTPVSDTLRHHLLDEQELREQHALRRNVELFLLDIRAELDICVQAGSEPSDNDPFFPITWFRSKLKDQRIANRIQRSASKSGDQLIRVRTADGPRHYQYSFRDVHKRWPEDIPPSVISEAYRKLPEGTGS